jgi:hypothetical protein
MEKQMKMTEQEKERRWEIRESIKFLIKKMSDAVQYLDACGITATQNNEGGDWERMQKQNAKRAERVAALQAQL